MKRTVSLTMNLALALAVLATACSSGRENMKPLRVVDRVDLDRYLGTWFEIARYPNRFQKGCVDAQAQYRLRPDGKIRVLNTCREEDDAHDMRSAEGKAWVVDGTTNAKLKVSFFWPFAGDYWIIDLGQDYEYAVVGDPKRNYLWILNRRPTMDADLFQAICARLREQEYDPDKLLIGKRAIAAAAPSAAEAAPKTGPEEKQAPEK